MEKVQCEVCNSTHLTKDGDYFVCESCGMKYHLADIKNMLSGKVEIVKGENTLKDLYDKAYFYLSIDQKDNAKKIFYQIQQDFPKEFLPWFEIMKISYEHAVSFEMTNYLWARPDRKIDTTEFSNAINEILLRDGGREKCIDFFYDEILNLDFTLWNISSFESSCHFVKDDNFKVDINFLEDNPKCSLYIPMDCFLRLKIVVEKLNDKLLNEEWEKIINTITNYKYDGTINNIMKKDFLSGEKFSFSRYEKSKHKLVYESILKAGHNFLECEQNVTNWRDQLNIIIWDNFIFLDNTFNGKPVFDAYELTPAIISDLKNSINKMLEEEKISNWKKNNKCQYCGGDFKGFFVPKCSMCGRKKDYE